MENIVYKLVGLFGVYSCLAGKNKSPEQQGAQCRDQ